jgi:hypothetical protein
MTSGDWDISTFWVFVQFPIRHFLSILFYPSSFPLFPLTTAFLLVFIFFFFFCMALSGFSQKTADMTMEPDSEQLISIRDDGVHVKHDDEFVPCDQGMQR